MDRPTTRKEADATGTQPDPVEAFVLPSRRPALDACLDPARVGAGPILVTGDAGVGKSWLLRRMEDESPDRRRWLGVDLTPANGPADFYRLVAHELGLTEPGAPGASRVDLVDYLAERHADGERAVLAIEEAHNLSPEVWEEVRVLANRLDRPGGFSAIVLIGQTSLARRLTTRPFAAIEARLAAKVHLGPIDVDEAGEWLARLRPDREWDIELVEAIHRDTAGNPRKILRRLAPATGPIPSRPARLQDRRVVASIERAQPEPKPALIVPPTPLTGPDRPPIRVEENMIEVGWSPDDTPVPAEGAVKRGGSAGSPPAGEEAVQDHYAALQAWREWTENQGSKAPMAAVPTDSLQDPEDEDVEADEERSSPLADRPTIWAEGEQRFAPFSQLFSRMAPARDPE